MNYWVDKGVDGCRLDVINLISKDESQYYVDSTITVSYTHLAARRSLGGDACPVLEG